MGFSRANYCQRLAFVMNLVETIHKAGFKSALIQYGASGSSGATLVYLTSNTFVILTPGMCV